ncbi:hypothetical protein [Streptomyces sp. NPDC000618]|uniref:hypothetical protein n=1 Tax=Streptomyces sp. NPDC000618 TaxID=3154265 RepID=UPI00331C0749
MNPSRRTTVATATATAAVLAATGSMITLAAAPAAAATTCASPVYKRQIFANTSFSDTAKRTGCDAAIIENWGTRASVSVSGVPSNHFSVAGPSRATSARAVPSPWPPPAWTASASTAVRRPAPTGVG